MEPSQFVIQSILEGLRSTIYPRPTPLRTLQVCATTYRDTSDWLTQARPSDNILIYPDNGTFFRHWGDSRPLRRTTHVSFTLPLAQAHFWPCSIVLNASTYSESPRCSSFAFEHWLLRNHIMAKFSCIESCNKSFKTEHGLRMHRISCKKYNYEDTDLQELARRLAARREAAQLSLEQIGFEQRTADADLVICCNLLNCTC